jgi:ketosteroid isomerase-like protein
MKRNKLIATLALGMGLLYTACQQNEEKQVDLTANQPAPPNTAAAEASVRDMLAAQSACWSQGDLDCFMQDYWKSDSLLFVGKNGLTYGWQQTLENYRKSYPDPAAMGRLTFELKEMRYLASDHMLVVGKWHLQREADLGNLQGHFSIILKHFPEGWKIVADHSS